MRLFIISLLMLLARFVTAQTNTGHPSTNYEAANWKLWLLDSAQKITITAPPAQSKAELQNIKRIMSQNTEKDLAEIKYWNAGAPAYRWNQIIPGLIEQKQEV